MVPIPSGNCRVLGRRDFWLVEYMQLKTAVAPSLFNTAQIAVQNGSFRTAKWHESDAKTVRIGGQNAPCLQSVEPQSVRRMPPLASC